MFEICDDTRHIPSHTHIVKSQFNCFGSDLPQIPGNSFCPGKSFLAPVLFTLLIDEGDEIVAALTLWLLSPVPGRSFGLAVWSMDILLAL